jgi:hypothetical protein
MTRLIALAPLFLLVTGCGNNSLDHDSAVKVTSSALTATASAQVVAAASITGNVDVTIHNPAGTGSAHVVGTRTKGNGDVTNTLDITFDKWADNGSGLVIDGTLHAVATFSTPLPTSGAIDIEGALAVSGSADATAEFKLTGDYGPDGFDVNGHVAGQPISGDFSISVH